jgi:hypothetical protein
MQRLTDDHKKLLYRIAIRQDEQGRQPTYMQMAKLESHSVLQDLIELKLVSYDLMGQGEKAIASLMVTLPGLRYCTDNINEVSKFEQKVWTEAS